MNNKRAGGGLVYSTDGGTLCPQCRQPVAQCTCKRAAPATGDGTVRVSRETAGRSGKAVTVVRGLALDAAALGAWAAERRRTRQFGRALRRRCGWADFDHRGRVSRPAGRCTPLAS